MARDKHDVAREESRTTIERLSSHRPGDFLATCQGRRSKHEQLAFTTPDEFNVHMRDAHGFKIGTFYANGRTPVPYGKEGSHGRTTGPSSIRIPRTWRRIPQRDVDVTTPGVPGSTVTLVDMSDDYREIYRQGQVWSLAPRGCVWVVPYAGPMSRRAMLAKQTADGTFRVMSDPSRRDPEEYEPDAVVA